MKNKGYFITRLTDGTILDFDKECDEINTHDSEMYWKFYCRWKSPSPLLAIVPIKQIMYARWIEEDKNE